MTDKDCAFSKQIGWPYADGRTGRFAIAIDNGKVIYASKDDDPSSIETSGAEGVLKHL